MALPILAQSSEVFRCYFSEGYQANTGINFLVDSRDETNIEVTAFPSNTDQVNLKGSYRYYTRESVPNYVFPAEALEQLSLDQSKIVGATFYSLSIFSRFERTSSDLKLIALVGQGEDDKKLYLGAYGNYLGENIYCQKPTP